MTCMQWPQLLMDNAAIARFVADQSPYEICEEQIEEMYIGCRASLRWTPVAELRPGPDASNIESDARQAACNRQPANTMPPLLVEDGQIMDGHHRYRALKQKGITHCWAYHIEIIPEPILRRSPQSFQDEEFSP